MSTRRSALKALSFGAGAAALWPLMSKLNAQATLSKRFVFVIEGNGVSPGNFLTEKTRAALNAAGADIEAEARLLNRNYRHDTALEVSEDNLSTALALGSLGADAGEPLEDYASVLLGLSSKVSGGGHTSNFGALSCAPSRVRLPSAATIDHVLASIPQVRGVTPFDAVRLGIHAEDNLNYNTCALGAKAPTPITCDPTTAFLSLFGSVAAGAGADYFNNRRDLLDFMHSDVDAALKAFPGSSEERLKLERYLESVETLTVRHQTIDGMRDKLQNVLPAGPGDSPLYESANNLDKLEVMFELGTAALLGELTNVLVIASGTGERGYNLPYNSLGLEVADRHAICHANDYATLTRITERHVSLMAKLARALQATPEGDGSMLDNTLIMYMSDNGEKHHSNAEEWPILTLGGGGLGFLTGSRTWVAPAFGQPNNRQLSNLFSTLTHLAGAPVDDFGIDEARVMPGPLSELIV